MSSMENEISTNSIKIDQGDKNKLNLKVAPISKSIIRMRREQKIN
jgi:hypothetical protein